ncbi:hypothetical protein E4K10_40715 [Streptomyces sp. T1317-0309]|nr:hypothetical protein E4K10_40715 [Streptomyces sp. T1317-0309]
MNNWNINFDIDSPGVLTLELPAGTWSLGQWMQVEGSHGPQSRGHALAMVPQFDLNRDTTIVLSAAKARQMKLLTPRESRSSALRVDYTRAFPGAGNQVMSFLVPRTEDTLWAVPTAKVTKGTFDVRTRWRNEQPALKISMGGTSFDDLLVRRGTKPLSKGSHRLRPVYVGQGAAADYTGRDVRGKAAVVDRNDTVGLSEQAATAASAGAALLLVVNDGPGLVEPLAFDSIAPMNIATLDQEEGRRLISQAAKSGTALEVYSNPTTEYLYDVVRNYRNRIRRISPTVRTPVISPGRHVLPQLPSGPGDGLPLRRVSGVRLVGHRLAGDPGTGPGRPHRLCVPRRAVPGERDGHR